jgi:hypothetical protein
MQGLIHERMPHLKSLDDVTEDTYKEIMKHYGYKLATTPTKDWTFGGLKRQADGRFKDSDLAEIVKKCIEEPAHEFGAHGTPLSLKIVDIMGQRQAREVFNVCTLNE